MDALKSILGIAIGTIVLGGLLFIQCVYPFIKDSPDSVNEYGSMILKALEHQAETREECEKTLDQVCLTESMEELQSTIKSAASSAPEPMSVAHERLYSVVSEMVVLNRLSESPENLTPKFIERNISIIEEYQSVLQEWVAVGKKLSAE